jgi:annexin A7/11
VSNTDILMIELMDRMFNMALSGQRDENPYVDQQRVQQDVEALYRAGQGKIGTVSLNVHILVW